MPQTGSKRSFVRPISLAVCVTLLTLVAWCPAPSQGTDAGIAGRVLSERGAPIGDVIVMVRNTSTGFASATRSTDAG